MHGHSSVGGGGGGRQRHAVAWVARSVVDVVRGGVHVERLVGVLRSQPCDVTQVTQQPLAKRVATLIRLVRQLQPTVLKDTNTHLLHSRHGNMHVFHAQDSNTHNLSMSVLHVCFTATFTAANRAAFDTLRPVI